MGNYDHSALSNHPPCGGVRAILIVNLGGLRDHPYFTSAILICILNFLGRGIKKVTFFAKVPVMYKEIKLSRFT
jgi:hypothetical protein